MRELTECLIGLKFPRVEAEDRIREAFAALIATARAVAATADASGAPGEFKEPTDDAVLFRALRG